MTVPVTIAICTRERPIELARLLDSLGQSRFRTIDRPCADVLIVDNTPGGSRLDAADLERRCGWPVRIVEEPRTGVAYARNTVIANRNPCAEFLVCVDDDQVVTPSWLDSHLGRARETDAPILTGPVLVRIPTEAAPWARVLWQHIPRHPTGTPMPSFLGGNVCFRTRVFDECSERYDESQATATADDTDLGRRLRDAGYDIEWNDGAIAWEVVPLARLQLRWFAERYISFGGFESMWTRRHRGRRALARQLPTQAKGLAQGVLAAARVFTPGQPPERRAEHQAAAVAHTFTAIGWVGGIFGLRLQDYRRVTSESATS